MKSQVKFKLFDPNQWNMMDQVMLKVQTFQRFGIVLDQNTLSLRLFYIKSTYFWCLTMAQITEV